MSRDRHCAIEWGGNQRGQRIREFGFCDFGSRLVCREEAAVYEGLKDDGYEVSKHGWPDFLATRDDEVRLIEVKSENDRLTGLQKRVFGSLARLNAPVEVHHLRDTDRDHHKQERRGRATRVRKPRQEAE